MADLTMPPQKRDRFLQVASNALTIILTAATLTGVIALYLRDQPYHALSLENPSMLVTPVVERGGFIEVSTDLCLDDPDATVSISRNFVSLSEEGVQALGSLSNPDVQPGCRPLVLRYTLPAGVTAGEWRLGGAISALGRDGRIQSVGWFTAPFTVVEAGAGG